MSDNWKRNRIKCLLKHDGECICAIECSKLSAYKQGRLEAFEESIEKAQDYATWYDARTCEEVYVGDVADSFRQLSEDLEDLRDDDRN